MLKYGVQQENIVSYDTVDGLTLIIQDLGEFLPPNETSVEARQKGEGAGGKDIVSRPDNKGHFSTSTWKEYGSFVR